MIDEFILITINKEYIYDMSIIYDIRNLKTPQDLEMKRTNFFKTLRLQAKLNRDYEDNMIARQQIDKLGLAPMLDVPLNQESERTEVLLQYDIAVKHLMTIMEEQQALYALGRLTDEEVFQLNSRWEDISPILDSKQSIMSGQFFIMFFRRYLDNLEREGGLGNEIPLLESTIHQLPQDVRGLWLQFSKGHIDSQTGKPWTLDTLIGITASSLARSIQDVQNEVKNRMAVLSRYAPARIAATSYFEKPKKEEKGKKEQRSSYERIVSPVLPGVNPSETFATPMDVDMADAAISRGVKRGSDYVRFSSSLLPNKRGRIVDMEMRGTKRKAPGVVGQADTLNQATQMKRQRTTGTFRNIISPIPGTTEDYNPATFQASVGSRGRKRTLEEDMNTATQPAILRRRTAGEFTQPTTQAPPSTTKGVKRGREEEPTTQPMERPSKFVKSGMTVAEAKRLTKQQLEMTARQKSEELKKKGRERRLAKSTSSEVGTSSRVLRPRPGRGVRVGRGLEEPQQYSDDREQKEMERFDLLRGQLIAGNNSPEVLRELKQYLVKFITEERIPLRQGEMMLNQLTAVM